MEYFNGDAYGKSVNGVPIGITTGWSIAYPVEENHKGFMIGRGGGNVKRIRDKTNSQILIQKAGTRINDVGNEWHSWFLIRGLFKRNVTLAMEELAKLGNQARGTMRSGFEYDYGVNDEDMMKPCEVKRSYFVIHPEHVGIVLGKNGENAKRISRECGAFVYLHQGMDAQGPWFEIKGLYERNIERAYFMILEEAARAETLIPRMTRFLTQPFPQQEPIPHPEPIRPSGVITPPLEFQNDNDDEYYAPTEKELYHEVKRQLGNEFFLSMAMGCSEYQDEGNDQVEDIRIELIEHNKFEEEINRIV